MTRAYKDYFYKKLMLRYAYKVKSINLKSQIEERMQSNLNIDEP